MVRRTWPARQGRNPLAGVDVRLAESTVPYDEVLVRSALCNKLVFLCFIVSIAERHPRDNYMLVRQIEHFPYRPTISRPSLLRACFEPVGPCNCHNVRHDVAQIEPGAGPPVPFHRNKPNNWRPQKQKI